MLAVFGALMVTSVLYRVIGSASEQRRQERFNNLRLELVTRLPPGTDLGTAQNILSELHIGYSYDKQNRKLYGITSNTEGTFITTGLLFSEDIQVIITFDPHLRLEQIAVKRIFTGP